MVLTYYHWDPLLADVGITELRNDAVYMFTRNNELFIKRLQRRMDGGLIVIQRQQERPSLTSLLIAIANACGYLVSRVGMEREKIMAFEKWLLTASAPILSPSRRR